MLALADELIRPYRLAAGTRPGCVSIQLLLKAYAALILDQAAEGLRHAEQALSAFRQESDTTGLADAARLVACAMCSQDRRKEANRLLTDERS